jgi:hypothetical protein
MRVADLIPGFVDELQKLASHKQANVGALLGGAAGFALGGRTLGSKAVNTAVGAGLGALAGKALGGAKRMAWDEPHARAHRDLHGYVPSTVGQDPNVYNGA